MTKVTKMTKEVPAGNTDEELMKIPTTSGKIRYLSSIGMTRSAIASKLNKRYQHVRNVLVTPLKKAE